MRTHTKWTAFAVVPLLALAGCGDKSQDANAPAKPEMLVFAGAGLRPPVAELVDAFAKEKGVKAVTDYAGSEVLFAKIKLSQQGDIYMPGDKHYVDLAAEKGLVLAQKSICYFVPTILVQKGNPKKIAGIKDLLKPGVRLGLGDERACAIGRKSKKMFGKNNIAWADVEKNLKFKSVTVNELGLQIQAGSLDAVIVWDAVARYYAKHGDEVAIPVEQNVISTVDIGVLKFTRDRKLADALVEFAVSERGRAIFKKHNYCIDAPK